MIYLKPVGGLCNRMRAIDSMICLCEKQNQNLTIIWLKSHNLNCSFNDIFLPLKSKKINIRIIQNEFLYGLILRFFLKKEKVYKNEFWEKIYDSNRQITSGLSLIEADDLFYTKIEGLMESFFEKKEDNILIESCYRHTTKNQDSYRYFIPINIIFQQATNKSSHFKNTIGLHIRRTDHLKSIETSTDEKIIQLIDSLIMENPNCNFFLSTDCNKTKQNLLKRYKNGITVNQNLTYERNNKKSIQYAVLDLFCISKTERIHGSFFSTFSQVAADIGNIENIVIK